MKEETTNRGFDLVEFRDRLNQRCILQESSISSGDHVWLGVEYHRMHLSREDVRGLLPHLRKFVKTGSISIVKYPRTKKKEGELMNMKTLSNNGKVTVKDYVSCSLCGKLHIIGNGMYVFHKTIPGTHCACLSHSGVKDHAMEVIENLGGAV